MKIRFAKKIIYSKQYRKKWYAKYPTYYDEEMQCFVSPSWANEPLVRKARTRLYKWFGVYKRVALKSYLLSHGWVDKGDVIVRYSSPRIGWKPADGTLIVGYHEWPQKVTDIETLKTIIEL